MLTNTSSLHSMRVKSASAPARCVAARRTVVRPVRAAETEAEIDPFTGMPIAKNAPTAPTAGNTIQAGKYQWAYRANTVDESKAEGKLPVLLLHGIGTNSYCYRNTLGLLGGDGFSAIAPDWIGHGSTDKPTSGFDYSEADYVKELDNFVNAVGIKQPFALVVHGYILGQYGIQYALQNPNKIDRLMILNTPVALKSKLRPELAAYKAPLPFMRPGSKQFNGANFAAAGGPYAMSRKDANVYDEPYVKDPAATDVISKTMDKVDFNALVKRVDEGCRAWRKPTVLLFGTSDQFIPQNEPFDFLENMRTNMKAVAPSAQLGHMPQEDYAESIHDQMVTWLTGGTENFVAAPRVIKMTKKGGVEM